ncbi:MAG: NADP-dependent phosphogluconate dehydrogenase, partial [Paracoccaceae bacterium]
IGMGVSGGAEGARHGPSIMVGGPEGQYEAIRDVVEAIAAPYDDKPCAAHLGPDGAGHFVKTVHNGIEYADMQLIAEVFDCLRDGGARRMTEIATLFSDWNTGPLNSYLVEITAKILGTADPETGQPVVDVVLDRAGQKGTGRWTAIEALRLGRSPSVIEAAVGARSWSAEKAVRETGQNLFMGPDEVLGAPALDADLEAALLAARIIAYAQGFSVLAAASDEYQWDLDMARIAEIWRAGCIIRSGLLDDIALAFRNDPPQGQMIFAPFFVERLEACMPGLRRVVAHGAKAGLPMPALSAALSWFDTMRRACGPASLIQAQRDFFGAHGFERVDAEGEHHGPWA